MLHGRHVTSRIPVYTEQQLFSFSSNKNIANQSKIKLLPILNA